MNPLTKQELQMALQQIAANICARTASQQEVVGAMQSVILPRLCTRQDIQFITDAAKEKMCERISTGIREQNSLIRHMILQIEETNRHFARLQEEINNMRVALSSAKTGKNVLHEGNADNSFHDAVFR